MQAGERRGLSIFFRLLIAFLVVVIVVTSILTAVFYIYSKRSRERHTIEDILQRSKEIEHYFKNDLRKGLVRDLYVLASNPTLDAFLMSSELEREINAKALEKLFQQTIQHTTSYESIYFVNSIGKENVKVDRSGRVRTYRNLMKSDLFKHIESGIPGSLHIEGPFKDKKGKVLFSIGIHKTDADIGRFGGAVIIDYSLEEFFSYMDNVKVFGETPIWILTQNGEVLKQPQNSKAILDPLPFLSKEFQERPLLNVLNKGVLVYQDLSIVSDKPLLRAVISIPSSLLFEDVRSVLRFFLIVFIISTVITLIIALFISKTISRPIIELSHAAARLAKGDLSTQIKVKTSGEVQMLVDSFNQMAKDIEKTTVSRDYVDNIINSIHAGILVIDPEKHEIIGANSHALKMVGVSEEKILGQICHKFTCPAEVGKCPITDLKQTVDNSERVLLTAHGNQIPILKSVAPVTYKGHVYLIESFIDITERKKAEIELKMYAEKLEQSNKELERFVYIASHDLQEPLRKVIGFGDKLKTKLGDNLHSQSYDYLERMLTATKYMGILINDLLNFLRITTKAQPFIPVDLNKIVQEALSDLEIRIEQTKGHIEINNLPAIDADPMQMKQLFKNLIDNALKFHKKDEPPIVKISTRMFKGQRLSDSPFDELCQIIIEDNGIGFDEKYLERIFGVFQRLHGHSEYEGTGMGLAICKKIIERHGGSITAKSAVGQGTTFVVTLPLKQAKGEQDGDA